MEFATNPALDKALVYWLFEAAPFGILVTDERLKILFANDWFRRCVGDSTNQFAGQQLFDAFPDVLDRGFDRYYRDALSGQTRILSHRFHKYLVPMAPCADGTGFEQMQQSARISPLIDGESIVGTVSVIDDVTERVSRETELDRQIESGRKLLLSEISARQLTEENSRLRGSFEALRMEGDELLESRRIRDKLMHRIITSQEEERQRVARDVHDLLGQQLTALRFTLSRVKSQLSDGEEVLADINVAEALAKKLDAEVDFLARQLQALGTGRSGFKRSSQNLYRRVVQTF